MGVGIEKLANWEIKDWTSNVLWRIYRRAERPLPWQDGGNFPWDDPAFSARMLREHLDDAHGAASRQTAERQAQIAWLWEKLALQPGRHLLDITCGPGLYAVPFAQRGCRVTGVDFSPAAVACARELAVDCGASGRCHFIQQDIRQFDYPARQFDAAILLYGQLAVFPREQAQEILRRAAQSLQPGGHLALELLNPEKVDKTNSSWWYTDDTGLWGDAPYLHLGERFWDETTRISTERYLILHLEDGRLDEIILSDQTYEPEEMRQTLRQAGFGRVDVYPAWDGLPLYDADEWLVYVAERL